MKPEKFSEIQEAIRQEKLDGWLFCNFRHRDPLADEILGINPENFNSRRWFYAVPAEGEAQCILHFIEPNVLGAGSEAKPGKVHIYSGREELLGILRLLGGKKWGCHFSPSITAISFLDAGTAALLEEAGLELVSAAGLIQRFKGLLDSARIESHERAACHLYEIVDLAWSEVRRAFDQGRPLYEDDIQRFMTEEISKRGLVADHPPIIAAGCNTGNPHHVTERKLFAVNDVIQFDVFAKEAVPGGIFADISWAGVYGHSAPPEVEKAFSALIEAREGALKLISEELEAGRRPMGADVDQRTRQILTDHGYAGAICHRTGHGIDTEVHGSGVNMDSVEFPDSRVLLDGSCFSLEPGIYFKHFGMRTEIDVYIKNGKATVSGKERQFKLLLC